MTENRLIGDLLVEADRGTVRMDDLYSTDIDDLWNAITSPDRLARWLGAVEGDFVVGGTVHMRLVSGWDGPARIEACEPPHRVALIANPSEPDQTRMEAVLTREGERTRLVIEESGFRLDIMHFHGSGWQTHVEDLRAHLEGRPVSDWETRSSELTPAYEELAVARRAR